MIRSVTIVYKYHGVQGNLNRVACKREVDYREYIRNVIMYITLYVDVSPNLPLHRCASRQYMSAIFYHDDTQKALAEETRDEQQKRLTQKIVTRIVQAETFYDAEE